MDFLIDIFKLSIVAILALLSNMLIQNIISYKKKRATILSTLGLFNAIVESDKMFFTVASEKVTDTKIKISFPLTKLTFDFNVMSCLDFFQVSQPVGIRIVRYLQTREYWFQTFENGISYDDIVIYRKYCERIIENTKTDKEILLKQLDKEQPRFYAILNKLL